MSPSEAPSRAQLEQLKERQIAFFRARLVSEEARLEWRANLGAAWEQLQATQVASLFDGDAVAAAIDAAMSRDAQRNGARPIAAASLMLASSRIREDRRTLGDFVPEASRVAIDALLEEPKLLPEQLLSQVMMSDAFEEVMRDVLFDALSEFSDKVNPFFADWGLPGLVKKLSPFGLGGMGKGLDGMRAEFEKRLQPEIRKFLQGFSRRALRDVVRYTLEKQDDPSFITLRKELARFALAQPISDFVGDFDDPRLAKAQTIAFDLAEEVAEKTLPEVRAVVAMAIAAHGKQTLREALDVYGVSHQPDLDALANVTWPFVRACLASPAIDAWVASLIAAFFDAEAAAGP